MCVSILGNRSFSSVLAIRQFERQFLPMLSLSGFRIGMIIALCHISGICPVEIEDVSRIVDGTMSELLDVEGAHPIWSGGCGRFGQLDRYFCVSWHERRCSC